MKLSFAMVGAAVLGLSGCVVYDDAYRTTGRVGENYGTYRGTQAYPQSRTRLIEDRAGNVYRIYPDGTTVLVARAGYSNYPYGNGGYSTYPYGYGGYSSYPYGYGGYSGGGYGYGGYGSYPRGVYVGPPQVYAPPRPRGGYPTPPPPAQPVTNGAVPPSAPSVGSVAPAPVYVPPAATAQPERAERAEARRESHTSRELRATDP